MTRVLVLTPRFPFPMKGGDALRIGQICYALSERADVSLLSLCDAPEQLSIPVPEGFVARDERVYLPRWRSLLQTAFALAGSTPLQVAYYRSSTFADRVRELAPHHDVVLAHLIRTADYALASPLPRVLEMTDSPSFFYGRARSHGGPLSLKSLAYAIEAGRVGQYEAKISEAFDLVGLVSPIDRAHLLEAGGNPARIIAVGNGVDTNRPRLRNPGRADEILFIGNMRTLQNQDSCRYMVHELLPRLNRVRPFRLRVVGPSDERFAASIASEHVIFHGFAEDLAMAAANAVCGVCLMRIAAGIQNKILDYLSIGLPAVVNTMALEGLAARPGDELLLADSPEGQCEAILRLVDDRVAWNRLSAKGSAYVTRQHDWSATLAPLADAVLSLAAR